MVPTYSEPRHPGSAQEGQMGNDFGVAQNGWMTAGGLFKGVAVWCGLVTAVACGRSLSEWAEARLLRHQWEAECRRLRQTSAALAEEQQRGRRLRQDQEAAQLES